MAVITTTIDETGKPLAECVDGTTCPSEYTFSCINDFVHSPETGFEELQGLCLGMATEIEKLRKEI